jgi:hypothetical protein
MDGSRFDSLVVSLHTTRSRRRALAGLLAGALGFLSSEADEAVAKNCKKIKNKTKRKKCLAKAKQCVPNCAGKVCGDDGCGGTCGVACSVGQRCQSGACVTVPCGAGGVYRVFVTSTTYTGNLGGLLGADAKCQERAEAVDLPGTYMAWLSDSSASPASRFTWSPGPYQLVTGATVANNWGDLTDSVLAAAIQVTETSLTLGYGEAAWTNTKADGTRDSNLDAEHCTGWTMIGGGTQGKAGSPSDTTDRFTVLGTVTCSLGGVRLYCFQQSG